MSNGLQGLGDELYAAIAAVLADKRIQGLFPTGDKPDTTPESEKEFQDFLKEEYRNIASAHFNVGSTINQFFQFYLLIIGIPVTGAGVLARFGGQSFEIDKVLASPITAILASAIAITGVCMLAHLVNLRLEALHYARTVNGIRKYFYKRQGSPSSKSSRCARSQGILRSRGIWNGFGLAGSSGRLVSLTEYTRLYRSGFSQALSLTATDSSR